MTPRMKYLFLKMMAKHAPMKRHELTQRALPHFKIKMIELTDIITELEKDKLIEQYRLEVTIKKGADYFAITIAGKIWLDKKNQDIKAGVRT